MNDFPYGYQYYTIGLGGTYRLSLEELADIPNVETYVSGVFSYRLGLLNGIEDDYTDHRQRIAVDYVVGAMYHFKGLGVFAEFGSSGTSNLSAGVFLTIKKNKKI